MLRVEKRIHCVRTMMTCGVALLLTLAPSLALAEIVTSGLVVWYDARNEELNGVARTSGSNWLDRAGNDNNIGISGAFVSASPTEVNMYSQTGQSGQIWPGTQDVLDALASVTATNGINVSGGLTGITVELLMRAPLKLGAQQNIVKSNTDSPGNWRLWTVEQRSDNTLNWWVYDTDWRKTSVAMPNDQWVHVLGVWGDTNGNGVSTNENGYNETLVRLYLNGVEVSTGTGPASKLNSQAQGKPMFFEGGSSSVDLAFARFYTRALTPDEVAENWGDAQTYFGVPEPGTLVLLAAGLFGLLAYAWRRRK